MYRILEFNLWGHFAFFKKPDINEKERFITFSCIHKVVLYGIIGAIIGLNGYEHLNDGEILPEFLKKLRNLKVAIIPLNKYAYISKHMSQYNNSSGFASRENGNILVIHEQWLENPKWKIQIMIDPSYYKDKRIEIDSSILKKIEDYILNSECVFIPYLGSNTHGANITEVSVKKAEEVILNMGEKIYCESLFYEDLFDTLSTISLDKSNMKLFKYKERLPVDLDDKLGCYVYKYMVATNRELIAKDDGIRVFRVNDKLISLI